MTTVMAQRHQALILGVANVLDAGRTTALRTWDKDRCDIYHCASRAWRSLGMPVPLSAVNAQLRSVVPGGNLIDYQDVEGRTRSDIAERFTQARNGLLDRGTDYVATSLAVVMAEAS